MPIQRQEGKNRPTRPKLWTTKTVWYSATVHGDPYVILTDFYRRYYRYRFLKKNGVIVDRKITADRKFELEAAMWALRSSGTLAIRLLLTGIKVIFKIE